MTTQYANASYQEIIDIKTEADKTSIIGIHTPNDAKPVNMLRGFWEQFRQFRYNGCSIQLVPAARLPADISQVGYGAGEAPIDMRDILNPIMFKGCHGDDLGVILNEALNHSDISSSVVRSDSPTEVFDPYESLYYRALTDNSWRKADPQRGFRKSGLKPLVHTMVSCRSYGQFAPGKFVDKDGKLQNSFYENDIVPDEVGQIGPEYASAGYAQPGADLKSMKLPSLSIGSDTVDLLANNMREAIFTNRLTTMSWQDTHSQYIAKEISYPATAGNADLVELAVTSLFTEGLAPNTNRCNTVPLAYMGMLLLPPAYKAEQYFRMIINHSFSFRRFRGVSMQPLQVVNAYQNSSDWPVEYDGGYTNGVE